MVIQEFTNRITAEGKYFLNKSGFIPEICFESDEVKLNYVVISNDIILTEGILHNSDKKYRFNFDRYIKVGQQREINFTSSHPYIYNFVNDNTNKFIFILDTEDILSKLEYTILPNGKYKVDNIYSEGEVLYSDAVFKGLFEFYDKYNDDFVLVPKKAYKGTWFPLTIYKDKNLSVEIPNYLDVTFTSDTDSEVYLVWIPEDATMFKYIIDGEIFYVQLKEFDCRIKVWYYYGLNGGFDVLYTNANVHEVQTTKKEYINIGINKLPLSQSTETKYIINTGFGLTEFEVYNLLRSPYLYVLYQGTQIPTGENLIIDSLNVSDIDLKYPERLKHPLINGREYIMSLVSGSVTIQLISELNDIVVDEFELTSEHLFSIPLSGTYYLKVIGSAYKLKLEYSFEGYIITEKLASKLYKLEKMGKATEWLDSADKVYQPKLEQLLILTDSFDGYKGKTLLNKNIEIEVTKPYEEKRYINFKPNFYL
jgi:hypothetical protein